MNAITLQPREAATPHLVNVLRGPKRVRVRFAGRTVADSRDLLVLRANHFLPIYFFPADAVAQDVLKPSARRDTHAAGGERRFFDLSAGARTAPAGAWLLTAPPADLAALEGRIAFEWNAVDQWFEEDEEVFVHARDPYARIDVLRSASRVEVWLDGEAIADSSRPVLLFETHLPTRYYLPHADVRLDRLVPSTTTTRCPYKGVATYWSAVLGDGTLKPDVAWSYQNPVVDMPKIKRLIAFYPQAVDRILLDGAPPAV